MYTYTKRCRRFIFGGNELLRFSASLPCFEERASLTSFYRSVADNCETWCETELFPLICREAPITDINFRRQLYSFEAEVTYSSDELICILAKVTLSQGRNRILSRFEDAQIWRTDTESLFPPKQALSALARELGVDNPKFSSKYRSVMLNGKNIFALVATDWVKINIENQLK